MLCPSHLTAMLYTVFMKKKKTKLCATQTLRKMYQNIMISGMTSVHYVEQSQMHQAYPLKG